MVVTVDIIPTRLPRKERLETMDEALPEHEPSPATVDMVPACMSTRRTRQPEYSETYIHRSSLLSHRPAGDEIEA